MGRRGVGWAAATAADDRRALCRLDDMEKWSPTKIEMILRYSCSNYFDSRNKGNKGGADIVTNSLADVNIIDDGYWGKFHHWPKFRLMYPNKTDICINVYTHACTHICVICFFKCLCSFAICRTIACQPRIKQNLGSEILQNRISGSRLMSFGTKPTFFNHGLTSIIFIYIPIFAS